MATRQTRIIHGGDRVIVPFATKDCAGTDVDLSDLTVTYFLRQRPTTAALVTKAAAVAAGLAEVTLEPADTARTGSYFHELVATDGTAIATGFAGYISFQYDLISAERCSTLQAVFDMDVFGEVVGNLLDFSVTDNGMYAPIFNGGL
jgi:hypothetical protein